MAALIRISGSGQGSANAEDSIGYTRANFMFNTVQDADDLFNSPEMPSLTAQMKADVLKRFSELTGHRPTIAIFGKTGAGKSSLGNAIFGRDVFPVSSVRAGTRVPKPLSTLIGGVDMMLIDFPGVGESREKDEEYRALYQEWMPQVDVALWVIKMDDRVLGPDLDYFERVVKPSGFTLDRIVFVVSQVEKADPIREWETQLARPGPKQRAFIHEKVLYIREVFDMESALVVPISAQERYNLPELAEAIINACPKEAALNIARALEPDLKTEVVRETVFRKVWSAIKAFYNQHDKQIHESIGQIVSVLLAKRKT